MALNPFFLQGTRSEQRLVQDLINEHLTIHGIEVTYIPRKFVNKKTILEEVQSSKFDDNYSIEAYLNTYEGYSGQGDVLTVAHVCEKEPIPDIMSVDGVTLHVEVKHKIKVIRGSFVTSATIIRMDVENDLCLLALEKEPENVTLPKIAKKPPERGSSVHYAGAPYGMMTGDYMVTFNGTFAGRLGSGFGFSLPCAPGASGSSIRNKKGEIVGTLGQSGRATGPHLDIRLNWFDVKLDPASILN